ncbi:nitroreductase [Sphingobium chlorophenolicum L-1]|uniref:Nitroreductase n=2 Tax=Sphingobium chlorophenolicum TaxID=46429 RepID=F6F225_SPHCR|nr:nitroreductase [Sphingobium chlorophenolicum L-1]
MSDMDEMLTALLARRRSVRGFMPADVPADQMRRIFSNAQLAPSNCNVQPWIVHIVSGGKAAEMRQALEGAATDRSEVRPDFELTEGYAGIYRSRQIDAAKALFAATGVGREDPQARRASFIRNFRFFDAPHAAFIFLPPWAGWREAADVGMYAQTLMLALSAEGLASCAQGALSHHADVVKRVLGVDEELRLLFGIAFGFEDPDHPANQTRTDRAPIAENHCFHG